MFLISLLLLLLLQPIASMAIKYDDDINRVFPSEFISHSPLVVPDDRYIGDYNNCACHESPKVLVYCFGEHCRDFPIVAVTAPLFKLKLSAIITIRRDDFQQLSNIEALEIEGNDLLTTIQPGCFRKMAKLRNLTIFNNYELKYLDENVFDGLINLNTLFMSKNGFNRVIDAARALSPRYLPHLSRLDLSQNIFHSIEENEFHYMNNTKLQKLTMYLCGIIYIHPNCLQPFRNLTILRLGQNLFNRTTITTLIVKIIDDNIPLILLNLISSGFRKTPPYTLLEAVGRSNISQIVLARNHFDEITDDSFPDMPHLETVDLRECLISNISNNAFKKLSNTSQILLNRNRLNTVHTGVLLQGLALLDLADNSDEDTFFFIPDRIFENLTILQILQLSYNNIQYITSTTFVGLTNLNNLGLKKTQLSYIEDGTFIHTPKLSVLNLMNNPLLILMPMTAETFRGLTSLNVALLGFCAIQNLTANPGIFHYFQNLTFLGLDNNDIQTIAPNQLTHLNILEEVHLENNKLIPWNKEIFAKGKIVKLIACQNKFTYITKAMLEDFKSVKLLSLDGNPLRCDCSLYPIVQWLRHNKMAIDCNDSNNFIARCDSPDHWRKVSIVEYLNYLKNNISDCEATTYSQIITLITLLIILLITVLLLYLFRWYIRYWIFLSKLSFMKHNFWALPQKLDTICSYKYDAFISYSVEDQSFVLQLCNVLEPALKLCLFERDFPVGTTITHAVLHAVTSSRRTILIVSEAFAKSQWCRWETQLAQYYQLFFRQDCLDGPDDSLIVIRLQPVRKHATPTLRYLLKTRIYLNWPQEPEKQQEFWNRLKATLVTPKGEVNKER